MLLLLLQLLGAHAPAVAGVAAVRSGPSCPFNRTGAAPAGDEAHSAVPRRGKPAAPFRPHRLAQRVLRPSSVAVGCSPAEEGKGVGAAVVRPFAFKTTAVTLLATAIVIVVVAAAHSGQHSCGLLL